MAPPIVRGRELLPGLRQRAIGVGGAVAVRAFAGPFAWNAILRAVNAPQFFGDAALPVFPVSWQDTGSLFAYATLALILGVGPLCAATANYDRHLRFS